MAACLRASPSVSTSTATPCKTVAAFVPLGPPPPGLLLSFLFYCVLQTLPGPPLGAEYAHTHPLLSHACAPPLLLPPAQRPHRLSGPHPPPHPTPPALHNITPPPPCPIPSHLNPAPKASPPPPPPSHCSNCGASNVGSSSAAPPKQGWDNALDRPSHTPPPLTLLSVYTPHHGLLSPAPTSPPHW